MTVSDMTLPDPFTEEGVVLPERPVRLYEAGGRILDADWMYRGVRSPYWRAYYNLDPGAAIRVAEQKVSLEPDRVVLVPEGVAYDCQSCPGVRHSWLHFHLPLPLPPEQVITLFPLPESLSVWAGMWDELVTHRGSASLHHRAAGVLELILSGAPITPGRETDERFSRLHAWVTSRLDRPPSVDEMARLCNMERRTFLRWFRSQCERTPADFVTRLRMSEACRRLRFTDQSIDEIAAVVGYTDRHHFSRVFKQRVGVPPARWKRGG